MDRLLRQTLKASEGAATSACLDAETLAAWFDGGLKGAALEDAQAHAASCGRCRAIVSAMARGPAEAGPHKKGLEEPRRFGLRWLAWAAPLSAAAAAVVLWIVVPTGGPPAPPVVDQVAAKSDAVAAPAPAEAPAPAPAAPPAPAAAPAAAAPSPAAVGALEAAPKVAAQAPAPAPRDELRRDRAAGLTAETVAGFAAVPIIVSSPDASIRWRLTGSAVERSDDEGATWTTALADAGEPLTAASAPSPTICWVVGRAGTVLVSTDGRTFVRKTFPEAADLTSVEAADARSASVTTADGRVFVTADGGVSWKLRS